MRLSNVLLLLAATDTNLNSNLDSNLDSNTQQPPADVSQTNTNTPSSLTPPPTHPGYLRRTFPSLPWLFLPDLLTYLRCLSIPLFTLTYLLPSTPRFDSGITSSLIFALASLTDYLDGYLARRWKVCSDFGAFLDPVADKIMVGTAIILAAGEYGRRLSVPAAVILGREIGVSALREFMSGLGKRNLVKVGYLGKVKTAVTMISLTGLLISPGQTRFYGIMTEGLRGKIFEVSVYGIWLSAVLTVASAVPYFSAGFKVLREN
ncbi:hypothetical protein TrST_g3369 [Triparma strigata]|uniref:CDP-diacylglycerol--glycerol-3-phosphate 3-phosphatidyltransferase n=1 Tax=Triparma strigata TaxID=1606541 RepID=A0A9W7BXZ4_9STRA|nr:hypothetical protein TrST_g3369 [Triparma strigata]